MVSQYHRQFHVRVLTPTGQACSCDAVSVVFPASDGLAGVLGGRAPLVAMLGAGPLGIERVGGKRSEFYLSGGFAQVRGDDMTILAEQCVPVETLDARAAATELDEARRARADSPAAARMLAERVLAARAKLRVARTREEASSP